MRSTRGDISGVMVAEDLSALVDVGLPAEDLFLAPTAMLWCVSGSLGRVILSCKKKSGEEFERNAVGKA